MKQLGYELALIRDASACKWRIPQLSHCASPQQKFVFKIYLFIGKSDIQRRGEMERKIFHLLISSPGKARSSEPFLGLPHRCSVPKCWSVFDCFPRPQAGSWMGSGAVGIGAGFHLGFWYMQRKDFNH